MTDIFATNSCHCQQLICVCDSSNVQPMVVNTKDDFASRLNMACDKAPIPIQEGRGRRAELRRRLISIGLEVSGESVRKWLSGESIPTMDNLRFIATALDCDTDWLLTGRRLMPLTVISQVTASERAPEPYRPHQLSEEARELAEYYDKLPNYIRANVRANVVKNLIDFKLKNPDADIGNITDLLRNF